MVLVDGIKSGLLKTKTKIILINIPLEIEECLKVWNELKEFLSHGLPIVLHDIDLIKEEKQWKLTLHYK